MEPTILHALHLTLRSVSQIDQALRDLRHADKGAHALLLFCDLTDADALKLPQDEPLIRRLQSGVMAMERRRPGRYFLLVRRRSWDDALRMYAGVSQIMSFREVVAQLHITGQTQAVFDAASFTPGSLKERYSAVLFSDMSLACTPDTPRRMLHALGQEGRIAARILPYTHEPETVLARLVRMGYTPSAIEAARRNAWARRNLAPNDAPMLYSAEALNQLPSQMDSGALCPLAEDCFFVRLMPPALTRLFSDVHLNSLRAKDVSSLLPLIQLFLLALSAVTGSALLAVLTLALAEIPALIHPRQLPCALVRTALLPIHAALALDALLARALAHSKLFRLRVPAVLFTARGCATVGALMLIPAFLSAQALMPLLAVCLLWLGAPLLLPALASPTVERIPLDEIQQAQMRSLACEALRTLPDDINPARRMLAACASCMLGILEPDEAARRTQALFASLSASLSQSENAGLPDAFDQASLFCCAQFLRERMGDCDAALRPLPAQLESLVQTQPPSEGDGLLAAFMRAVLMQDASPSTLALLRAAGGGAPMDRLFLPLASAHRTPQTALTLPMTHPHTFLRSLADGMPDDHAGDPVGHALCLADAALSHPFADLLLRSPFVAPYAPAFTVMNRHPRKRLPDKRSARAASHAPA